MNINIKEMPNYIREQINKGNGTIVRTNGTVETIAPNKKDEWGLEELQSAVGGYIEIYPTKPFKNALIICDDEGLINGKQLNPLIYILYRIQVCGDVIIIQDKMLKWGRTMGRGRPRLYTPKVARKRALKSQDAWDKANSRKITFKCMLKSDKDILDYLDTLPNKSGYIKQLIREDIKKGEH